jgi:hypothetical protein
MVGPGFAWADFSARITWLGRFACTRWVHASPVARYLALVYTDGIGKVVDRRGPLWRLAFVGGTLANTYNIFISHSWAYGDAYDGLVKLLNQRGYFPFRDFSVPKDDPIHNAPDDRALYEAIYNQIRPASVVLIMAGVYATYSRWIQIEIEIAQRGFALPKPIIAVRPWAQTNVSRVVSDAADEMVGWNTESIVSAIRRLGG